MVQKSLRGIGLALLLLLAPATAFAQSAISGLVRDTSGAVMPGVTVEVASPVLIEKVRSAVSDENGRYTIVDLRPGSYSVTFTLPGFNTYKQDGLDLPANFTATVNAEMRVGALEESVTVTGAAPMVPDMADACCRQADDAAGRALSPALVVMAAPPPEAMAAGLAASALDVHRRVVTGPAGSPPDHAVPKYLRFSVFLV